MNLGVLFSGPTPGMPRPDRVIHRFNFNKWNARPELGGIRDILVEYDQFLLGPVQAPGNPGRSENLVLQTTSGKKILKRYKSSVDVGAIFQEHSILGYLAKIDFPAPRLVPAADGATFIQKGDHFFALFDFFEGYFQYHHYFLLPAQTHPFIAASGKALATLHAVLKDFNPMGQNQNGFKSRQGDRWREINWYLDLLHHCSRELPTTGRDQVPTSSRLRAHSGRIEERLIQLDELLRQADPPRLIIHGDYGPYNLFFKRDHPVVILDFELSRLDWRLTDLSNALPAFARSRLGVNLSKIKLFISAYQMQFPMEAAELSLLPSVWQFLTLRRIIVCWHRYLARGEMRWLREARQKLDQLSWIEKNEQALSHIYR